MRILLLQHVGSRYGVLKGMSEALYSAFIRQGIETTLFDAWDQGPSELLRCIDEWKPEYTFSINLFAHKELPFDSYGINHIVLCVDALSNYKGLNEGEIESKHLNCLFVDAYSSDLYKARGGRACWFPHAISEELLDEIQTKKVLHALAEPIFQKADRYALFSGRRAAGGCQSFFPTYTPCFSEQQPFFLRNFKEKLPFCFSIHLKFGIVHAWCG
jgi:hypothetical protein